RARIDRAEGGRRDRSSWSARIPGRSPAAATVVFQATRATAREDLRRPDGEERDRRDDRDQTKRVGVTARLRALEDGERDRLSALRRVARDEHRRAELSERAREREQRS